MRRAVALVACFAVIAATAPAARAQSEGGGDRVTVVASFSILGDLVARVGGDRVAVTALVGPGGNAHVYVPTPAAARRVGAARLLVVNGLGFEGWMGRLVQASASKAQVVVASAGVVPRHDHAAHGDVPEADPHAWQSVHNVSIYVSNIRDGLVAADPAGRTAYEANAASYLAELAGLDADIRRKIAAIPPPRRKVVTTHDAFAYFAADYGIAFITAQGVSGETEPSARDIAQIIRTIRAQNVPALFLESAVDPRLIRRIAAETGTRIGGSLFADTLDTTGPAATYVGMMRYNIRTLAQALR
ncbi:MAG: zinc ABC transporter substrate-binding protein [Bradyrhizobiaceae bacterium]|nr:zinc ABC transporter substrate-binding protein [Bradyrhizobiaceae bacterium]